MKHTGYYNCPRLINYHLLCIDCLLDSVNISLYGERMDTVVANG